MCNEKEVNEITIAINYKQQWLNWFFVVVVVVVMLM
jgi:hypothetical protein